MSVTRIPEGSMPADFKSILVASDQLVVVDFFATWCGPCKMIAPKTEDLASKMPDVKFLKVDVDECPDIAEEQDVQAMPTFVFYRNGKRVDEVVGASLEKIQERINEHS